MHKLSSSRAAARIVLLTAALILSACSGGSDVGGPVPPPPNTCTTVPPTVAGGYYDAARSRCGAALLATVHQIIRGQRVLDYTSARDSLYLFIDRGNQPFITDLYTGRAVPSVTTRATAAANSINTEHLWPRSRGAENEPGLSDLHHLFSSDETANSQRSNFPFGVVRGTVLWTSPNPQTPGDVSRLGYSNGNSGQIVFEPRPSKRGDIARALLYFYTRYNTQRPSGYSLANFAFERDLIIAWAREDAPDAWERARNDAVQRAQGNRNPYIDWPELLTLIPEFPLN
jgi:endonuclease I